LPLRELGQLVGGIDYATVSLATKRWVERMAVEPVMRKRARRAIQLLNQKT
jgi:hypothetical protein